MTKKKEKEGQKFYDALMSADPEKRDMALEIVMGLGRASRLGLRSARALAGGLDGLLISDGPRPECIRINCGTLESLAHNAAIVVEYLSTIGSMMRAVSSFAEHPELWEGVNHVNER